MMTDDITPFLNKKVTLIKGNNFSLTGVITKATAESIVFETSQATSVIDISHIKEIVMKKE